MYKNALETSANAAGTLNEQQDIFMESTTAHLQQMRTAAEGAYDSLLNVKTINTFVDGLTEILKIVEKLVNGLGGLKGILDQIVPMAGMIFNNQIASTITNVVSNIRRPKENQIAVQEALSNVRIAQQNIDPDILRRTGLSDLLDKKESILSSAQYLSPESLTALLANMDEYGNKLVEVNTQMGKVEASTKEWNDAQTNTTLKIDLENKSLEEQVQEVNRVDTIVQQYTENLGKASLELAKFSSNRGQSIGALIARDNQGNATFNQNDIDIQRILSSVRGQDSKGANRSIRNNQVKQEAEIAAKDYVQAWVDYLETGSEKELDKASEIFYNNITKAFNNTKDKTQAANQKENFLKIFNEELVQTTISKIPLFEQILGDKNAPEEVKQEIRSIIQEYSEMLKIVQEGSGYSGDALVELKNKFQSLSEKMENVKDETREAMAGISNEVQQAENGTNRIKNIFEQMKNIEIEGLISGITKGLGALNGAVSGFTSLSRSVKALASDYASAEEQESALIALIPTAITLFTALASTMSLLGIETLAAAWPLLAIAAAIAAIVTVITIVNQKEQDRIEGLKNEAEASRALYDEQANLLQQTKEMVKSYEKLNEQYENGQITLDELRQKTYELCIENDRLDLGVQALTASYEELNKIIKEAELDQLKETAEAAEEAYNDELAVNRGTLSSKGTNITLAGDGITDKHIHNSLTEFGAKQYQEAFSEMGIQSNIAEIGENSYSIFVNTDSVINNEENIKKWLADDFNKNSLIYKDIQEFYENNKEAMKSLTETRNNYAKAEMEYLTSSIDRDLTFEQFQEKRNEAKNIMTEILGTSEDAEKYIHDWFAKTQETLKYEIRQSLEVSANDEIKKALSNLSEQEIQIVYKFVNEFGQEDILNDKTRFKQALELGKTYEFANRIDNESSLIQGFMESGYQDMNFIDSLFKDESDTGLKEYLQKARKDIQDFSDFQKLTVKEQQELSNGYYKFLSQQSEQYYSEEHDRLEKRKEDLNEQINKLRPKISNNIAGQNSAQDNINRILENVDSQTSESYKQRFFDIEKEIKGADWAIIQNNTNLSNAEMEVLKKSVTQWREYETTLKSAQEELSKADAEIIAITDSLNQMEEVVAGRSLESLNKSLNLFMSGEADKEVKNAKKVLEKAVQEFNKEGDISLDTRQTLLALGPEYYDLWMNEAGAIDFNTQKIKTLTNQYYELMDAEAAEATQKAINDEANAKRKYEESKYLREEYDSTNGTIGQYISDETLKTLEEEYESLKKAREEQEIIEQRVNATTAAYREQLEVIEQFSLADFNKSASVIEAAKKEQEQYGQASSDTIEKLIALGVDYANCWEIVNGQLVINQEEIEEVKQKKYNAYVEEMTQKKAELTAEIALIEAEMVRASISGTISADLVEKLNTAKEDLENVIKALKNAENIFNAPNSFGSSGSAKTYTAIESREFHADTSAYDTQIKALQEDLNILRSEAEYLSGEDLNKNLEEQKAIMEEIVSLQSEKLSLSQQEQEVIKKDIEDLTGIKVETDKHGFITNLNALTGSYQSEMKAAADRYNNMIAPYGENGVTDAATQKEIEAAKKDYESKKKRYDTLLTYIKEYNTAVSSGKEAEKEIIKIANDEILSQETQRYEAESREIKKMADTYSIAAGSFDKFEKQWNKMSFDERIQSLDEYNKKMEESIALQKQYTENMGKRLTEVLSNGTVDISKITEGLWNGDLTDISEGAANIYTDYINRRIKELETATDRYEDLGTAEGQEYHSLLLLKDLLVPYAENLEEVNEKTKDLTVSSQTLADAADKYATTSIDRQIERAEKELARVKKQESGLKGNALIANLAKQNSLIQKQIELEKKKLTIIKAQLSMQVQQANAALKDLLANTGITLSLNEDLSNVTEITNALKDMDNLSAESYKLYSEALDKALATYSTYQSIQSEIESLTDEIADNAKKAAEKIKEELSKAFNAKVDVEVNIEDAWRNLHKLRAELEGLKDDDYFGNMNLQLKQLTEYLNTNPNSTLPGGSTQILTQHLQDIMSEIRTMQGGGTSKIYGTDQSAAFSDLQNYRDQLGSNVQSMMDSVKEMKQTYLSAIDAMISANDKFIQSIDKMDSILNNTMNIIKLVYGDDSYKRMDKYLRMSAQLAMNSATAARNNADNYRARMLSSTTEEEYRKWADAWTGAIDSVYSHAESAIKALSELAENNFKKIAASFTDQWKEIGENGLPLSISWEYEKTKVKDFYDYTNSMYQKDSLSRKIQKAIDEATDPTAINALQDAYANIIGYLDESIKKNKQLSKYEIERANKLYELTLKQIALEDERDNKTKMRLRRDQAGNYRYEYVADDNKVAQSEEDVEKAKNDIYNLAYNRAVSASDSINTYTEQMTKQLSEAAKMYNGDPEQLQTEFKKIYNKYNGLIKAAQNDIALSEQDLKKYGSETDSDFLNVLDHTQNFKSGLTEEQLDQIFGENVNYYEMMRALGVDTEQMAESDMATAQDISDYYQYYADKLADQVDQTKLIVDQLEAMEPMLKSLAETALATYEQSLLLREQEVSAITDANGTGANGASGPNLVTAIDRGGTMDYYKDSLGNKFYDSSIWKEEDAIKFLGPNAKPLDTFPRDGLIHTAVDSGYLTREAAKKNKAAEATNKAKEQANDNATEAVPDLEAIHNEYTAKAIEATKSGGATAGIFHELQGISSMIAKLPLEQHVQIDAQFQGKTKETEIFEALKGLVNRAAQVAENNGK